MSKKNYQSFEPCVVCNSNDENVNQYHHIHRRKTYPEHSSCKWNLISVCTKHHVPLFHDKGEVYVAEKYPQVKAWLEANGWYLSEFPKKKWVRDFDS